MFLLVIQLLSYRLEWEPSCPSDVGTVALKKQAATRQDAIIPLGVLTNSRQRCNGGRSFPPAHTAVIEAQCSALIGRKTGR